MRFTFVWFAARSVMLEEMRKDDQRVKYLWEVLEKFSNEDRSRFLRFVTGRRRLPAVMHVVGELVSTFFSARLLIGATVASGCCSISL